MQCAIYGSAAQQGNCIKRRLKQACACVQVLIDPVCMFTIYPQLLRNFIYRPPRMHWRMGFPGVIDGLRYLFARNLVIAEAFGRKLAWHKVCWRFPHAPQAACQLFGCGMHAGTTAQR